MSYPFRDHANDYLRTGWAGVLWLRPATKGPPPEGHTGHKGIWPSTADVQAWTEDHPDANIGLRLPEDVVGIDVDHYSGKSGGDTLAELEARLGPLPPTFVTTSRRDGMSGIRLFRCPPHPSWPSQAGDGIEMIHYGHRYAVVWPSLHPEGGMYRWVNQATGESLTDPPRPEQLAALPPAWVEYLQSRATVVADKGEVDDGVVVAWLDGLRRSAHPCDKVTVACTEGMASLGAGAAARHDAMVKASAQVIGLGAWGHAGVAESLTSLRDEFVKQVTSGGDGKRLISVGEATAEWRRAVAGAVAMHITERPEPAKGCSCPLPAFDPQLEETFWTARPVLEHIRQFARSRRTSPWAVLAITLVRVIVAMPPTYVLPAMIGGPGSLNLFVGIVARSGGGKGAAESAASEVIDVGEIHSSGVGSGEGILHQYVRYVPPDKKSGDPGHIDQHNDAVLFTAAEVDTLASLHQRQSSTLLSELRKVYMGEELSFAYVDPTKRLKLDKHAYRAGLIVGVQPARAAAILDDADGGTPQRFLWVPGTDPEMPDVAPPEPEPYQWARPTTVFAGVSGHWTIPVCAEARETVDREHVKRNRGDEDALNGHALFTRAKWAAALGILDGRLEVSDEDWRLSGILMALSDHTRADILAQLAERKRATNRARGIEYAEREVLKEERVYESAVGRVARNLRRKLEDGGAWPKSELRRALASRDRKHFDEAVEQLVEAGQAELDDENVKAAA